MFALLFYKFTMFIYRLFSYGNMRFYQFLLTF